MRTWFPYPLLSIALLLMWLLLSQSVTPGSIVLGLVVSTVLAWVTLNLQPARRVSIAGAGSPDSSCASSATSSAPISPSR